MHTISGRIFFFYSMEIWNHLFFGLVTEYDIKCNGVAMNFTILMLLLLRAKRCSLFMLFSMSLSFLCKSMWFSYFKSFSSVLYAPSSHFRYFICPSIGFQYDSTDVRINPIECWESSDTKSRIFIVMDIFSR